MRACSAVCYYVPVAVLPEHRYNDCKIFFEMRYGFAFIECIGKTKGI